VNVIKQLPEKDVYLRGLRTWVGFKQIGVPYVRDERHQGNTSNSFFANFYWAKKAIVNFSFKPLEYISALAAGAVGITMIASLFYLYLSFQTGAPRGFLTLLMALFSFGTIQLLSLSIIAEYLIRIFQEVKARPPYVIDTILSQRAPHKTREYDDEKMFNNRRNRIYGFTSRTATCCARRRGASVDRTGF
jgi:dolichol-phosphate mannosyltransferase